MENLSARPILEDWYTDCEEPQKPIHVDHFWRKVDGLKDALSEMKFPSIMKDVKTARILGHGNAEVVESGFSESGKRVTNDRVHPSEVSIIDIRAITDGLKAFKGPGSVPITRQLLQLTCAAHVNYVMHLDKEQKEQEEAKKQHTLQREQVLPVEAQKQQLTKAIKRAQ